MASTTDSDKELNDAIIGFGSNYFHALGGTTVTSLPIAPPSEIGDGESHEDDTVQAHVFTKENDYPWDKNNDSLLQVVCSASCTFYLTQQGHVYKSGTVHGRIFPNPTRLTIPVPRKCVQVSAGRHFVIGMLEQGIGVVSWGAGHFGQLGLGKHSSNLQDAQLVPHLTPQALGTARVKQVAAGAWHALALLDNGTCMAWGSNRKLQCGIVPSKASPTSCIPQAINFFGKFSKVTAGRLHSMGIEEETGRVYTWGASHHGQCGQYSRKSIAPPKLVQALQKVVVVDIAAGDAHSMALTGGGRVFVWGSGMDGQLGLGGVIPVSRPKLLADLDFVAIQAGREWKQQASSAGTSEPQFRDFATATSPSSVEDSSTQPPTPPTYNESPAVRSSASHLSAVPKIIKIHAAGAYSVAISSCGHVYTWGYNDLGQLGLPRSKVELPLVEMTSSMMKQSSSGRLLQIRSFESSCNVLLPRRVDCLNSYYITNAAVGPSHLWCIGTKRTTASTADGEQDEGVVVGQTLYEVQEERRRRGLLKMRKRLSSGSAASVESSSGKLSPTILSIQAVSKDSVEQVTIPATSSVLAHAESTGMDEDGSSSSTAYEEQQAAGIILPVHGEEQESPKKPAARQEDAVLPPPPIDSPASGDSLTATSVESPDVTPTATRAMSPKSDASSTKSISSPKSLERKNSLARLIGKRPKSRPTSPAAQSPPQEQVVNGERQFSPTSPTAASTGPLGFAGGKPQLPIMGSRNKVRSPTASSPPENCESDEQRRSISRLVRGRKNPKQKEEKSSKGRVRKALKGAFGK